MSVVTTLKAVADFSEQESRDLKEMKAAVYPDRPGGYPERAREWTPALWGVFVTLDDTLVSYTGIVVREARVDDEFVTIGGLGGIATHPSHRGRGYAPIGMGRALDFLLSRGVSFALLVCRDELVGYYNRLGWRRFEGPLLVTQFGEPEVFTFNNGMVGDLVATAPTKGSIDLLGPPW